MKDIEKLEPEAIWRNFYKLTRIPRGSKDEKAVIEYLQKFGEDLGLETYIDEVGNLLIRKPATNLESKRAVVLQSHVDMVAVKTASSEHNFETDPISTEIKDGWVVANDTTLGADNGIGVAGMMAILESADIPHPEIEALFTVQEEIGLVGATNLKPDFLKGEILLNLDSEQDGELFVGCAGGVDTIIKLPYRKVETPEDTVAYKLSIEGLKGGHSGVDIHKNRGNAILLLNRFLFNLQKEFQIHVSTFYGGEANNAIPRSATANIVFSKENIEQFLILKEEYFEIYKNEFPEDIGFKFEAFETELPKHVVSRNYILSAIFNSPNGVISTSKDIPDTVETSTNLGKLEMKHGKFYIITLQRSSTEFGKREIAYKIGQHFESFGAEVMHTGDYLSWTPDIKSEILRITKDAFIEKFEKEPAIKVIHAGLECGVIKNIFPKMDIISFGPTIENPHSPTERVNIETVHSFWELLTETLKRI
jgi:dipeptidase D